MGLLIAAACQPQTSSNNGDSSQVSETAVDVHGVSNMPTRFYKQFKGTIAGQPVTMQLIRSSANDISGYYVYDKIGEPIKLYSKQDTTGYLVLIEENYSGESENELKGKLESGAYAGNWTSGTKTYPFSLKEDNTGIIEFKLVVMSDTTKLRPNDPKSPSSSSEVSVLWPIGGAPEETLQMIRDTITKSEKKRFTDAEAYARTLLNSFNDAYMGDLKDVDTTETGMPSAALQWWSQNNMDVVWNRYPYLVLENSYYEFTGGAHGNGGSMYTFFDLAKNKSIKPGDVFKPGYESVVGKALEKAFRKKYGVGDNEELDKGLLFDKTIKPNDNFYMTDKYVVFSYTPYEIAAYAAGQITLAIPVEEIKSVLNR